MKGLKGCLLAGAALAGLVGLAAPGLAQVKAYSEVTEQRLQNPEPRNWLMYRGTYDGQGYSPLDKINAGNVADLVPVWTFSTGVIEGHQSPPIVNDGVMFITTPQAQVIALDAKTGDDITHQILTQIIMEEEASGEQMLPVNFLRQLISMYGNQMQGLVPHYLEASMEHFQAYQAKLHKAFEDSLGNNPLAKLAQQNMAMFRAAAAAFMPGAEPAPEPEHMDEGKDELAELRRQMAAMQEKLDKLAK